jgi:hypothetical protein
VLLLLKHISFKILTKFRFKKIWFEKHGRFIELWGEFNLRGEIKEVQIDESGFRWQLLRETKKSKKLSPITHFIYEK